MVARAERSPRFPNTISGGFPMKRPTYALGRLLVRALREDDGGEVLEYALNLGFLAIACYLLITMVGLKFVDIWARVDRVLTDLG
jgi:hypothetical protein